MRKRGVCASIATLLIVGLTGRSAHAGLLTTPPHEDPFYEVPSGIEDLAPGSVIDSRQITARTLGVPMLARAWQIRYRTIDQHGEPSAFVATVLVPMARWHKDGPRPLLAYNSVVVGLALRCAASYAMRAVEPTNTAMIDVNNVRLALHRGWAVVVPDYEGPRSEYLGMDGYATGVLDAIRAARRFEPAGIDPAAPVGMTGFSEGALATLAAALAQPTYAPDVELAGIAPGSIPADIATVLKSLTGQPYSGMLAVLLGGLDRSYPQMQLREYLNAAGRRAVEASQRDCILDAIVRHPGASIETWSDDPTFIDSPPIGDVLREASPLTRPGSISAPVLLHHSEDDELAPAEHVRGLAERFCADGAAVKTVFVPALPHFGYNAISPLVGLDYLADRFAGVSPPNQC